MDKTTATLFIGLIANLIINSTPVFAAAKLGERCGNNTQEASCAAPNLCRDGTCQEDSAVGDGTRLCKEKLVKNGLSSKERAAYHDGLCYHEQSCPEIYKIISSNSHLNHDESLSSSHASDDSGPYGLVIYDLGHDIQHFSRLDSDTLAKAQKACSQCTVEGKPRCFYEK